MIDIILSNGNRLDLFPDTNLVVKRNNPILAEGVFIPGEYSLPFDIPLSDTNKSLLKYPHIIENTAVIRKFTDVRIYIDQDGIFYKKGTLHIGKASIRSARLSVEFKFGLSSYADTIRSTKISDIVAEEIVLDSTVYSKSVDVRYNDSFTLEGNYSLTVNGSKYEGATLAALASTIDLAEQFVNANYFSSGFDGGPSSFIRIACAFSGFDTPLKVVPDSNQVWQIITNQSSIQEPVLTAIEPWLSETPPDDKIRFPMSINLKYRNQFQNDHYINFNANGQFIRNTINDWTVNNRNTIQPYIKLSHLLSKIADHLDLILDGDFITTDYFNKGLIDSNRNISRPADFAGPDKFSFTDKSFDLRSLVPDITIADLLKALQTRFNLAIYINENRGTLRLQHREPILLSKQYRDITELTFDLDSPDQDSVDGVALTSNQNTSDSLAPTDRYLFGSSEDFTIQTNCGSIASQLDEQSGLSMVAADLDSDPGLRLLFEGGILEDDSEILRNIASSAPADNYLFNDMWENRWKYWLNWHTRRKIGQASVKMGMRELTKIDWESKYRIEGNDYIIASTEEKITMQGIKSVKIPLLKT